MEVKCYFVFGIKHLAQYCIPVSNIAGCHHLRSAAVHQPDVPHVHHCMCGSRFCLANSGIHCLSICITKLLDTISFNVIRKRSYSLSCNVILL